ncbi:MAG: hypothetical protein J7M38_11755, partial [Armatimonadetes bacterium]|nr:hypothetical protein [Armatimonadota bacterium]
RDRIAQALREGRSFTEADVARALGTALGGAVSAQELGQVRSRLDWQCVQGRSGPLDIVEVTAALCGGGSNRLRSSAQLAAFVQAITT